MSSNHQPRIPSHLSKGYTPDELEAAEALISLRNPVDFSEQGATDQPADFRGEGEEMPYNESGQPQSAAEPEKKVRKITLKEYTAMKKASAAKGEGGDK